MSSQSPPFSLDVHLANPGLRRLWPLFRPAVERLSGLSELARMYRRAKEAPTVEGFVARTLEELGVRFRVNELDLARIPRSGKCIVVANHPFGAVEGLILAAVLRGVRSDVKILANYLLARVPQLHETLLFVDPFGQTTSAQANLAAIRRAMRFLKDGGMLAMFPAGEVAHLDLARGAVVDPAWTENLARLARLSKAPVLPVYFHGQNGAFFQVAGLVHPRLRTILLPRELLNKRHRVLDVRIGAPVPSRKLEAIASEREMVAYLRRRTTMLAERPAHARSPASTHRPSAPWGTPWQWPASTLEPVAPPVDAAMMAAEIGNLPRDQVLIEDGDRVVCWARAPQIPIALSEIGRLRELTFRQVKEGTGKARDLDRFDRTYLHLFMFDRRERAIGGAYRLGPTDELIAGGPRALYTNTLFKIDPELFRRVGPALEMGRSFVCERYQRSTAGLFLLWRGIGRFIAERPRYRVLFGPVSISAAYAQASRELMVDFIETADRLHPLGRYVRPRRPFARRRRLSVDNGLAAVPFLQDIEEVSSLVSDLEPDHKGVPILFRQYLKLGGKVLGFNVDHQFSGVLDGLVLVDLLETEMKTLVRYLGREAAATFLAYHRSERKAAG